MCGRSDGTTQWAEPLPIRARWGTVIDALAAFPGRQHLHAATEIRLLMQHLPQGTPTTSFFCERKHGNMARSLRPSARHAQTQCRHRWPLLGCGRPAPMRLCSASPPSARPQLPVRQARNVLIRHMMSQKTGCTQPRCPKVGCFDPVSYNLPLTVVAGSAGAASVAQSPARRHTRSSFSPRTLDTHPNAEVTACRSTCDAREQGGTRLRVKGAYGPATPADRSQPTATLSQSSPLSDRTNARLGPRLSMQGGTCSPEPGPPRNTGLRPNASSGSQTAIATAAAAADRSAAYRDQACQQIATGIALSWFL